MSKDLTCRELVELVTDYFEGALGRRDRKRFERHISMCSGCSAHLAQIRAQIELTGRLTEDDVTGQARADLLMAFREWRSGKH